jgi:hypothetical protein
MDPEAYKRLEADILAMIPDLFAVADRDAFQGRSREALAAALENELRFLGLYAYGDTVTPQMIHRIVEQHIDAWMQQYLRTPLLPTGHPQT